MKEQTVTVVIPNNLEFVSLITDVAGSLAKKMGFSDNEIRHIEIGSEEAISRIIRFAFDEGEETTVDVDFNIKKLGLEIVIKDKGMPYDPYTVRRMKPEEAVEVSKCAYTSYGYTYVHEDVYYPERLRTLNEDEDVISFVCVTDDGEIMAHAALEREKDRMVPQLGIAATKPKFRAQGCLGALNNALIDEAINGIFLICLI